MAQSGEHKLDYAIKYLKREYSRVTTERDVAISNKDFDLANDMEWISNGLDAAVKILEERRAES